MKWFQGKSPKHKTHNESSVSLETTTTDIQSLDTKDSEPQEPLLLLIRPSIPKIFEDVSDNSQIDVDGISTSFGMYKMKGIKKHLLEKLPILCVSESGKVGYTFPTILDLRLGLHQITTVSNPPIDYPLGLFTNRDVIVVVDGAYTVRLFHDNPSIALNTMGQGNEEIIASHIIFVGTTTDKDKMDNFRRLEATAKYLLSSVAPESNILPQLPPEIANDWLSDFLGPLFKHVKMKRKLEKPSDH